MGSKQRQKAEVGMHQGAFAPWRSQRTAGPLFGPGASNCVPAELSRGQGWAVTIRSGIVAKVVADPKKKKWRVGQKRGRWGRGGGGLACLLLSL